MLVKGATIVDGTGADRFVGDVLVADGRILDVGPDLRADDVEVVDGTGKVLAPGFIDIHTHYDAQVTWDGDLTPSSWHGITTVVLGNCGFGIAPTRPDDRETIARTLENVEGMSFEALRTGIDWSFETFPEFLDALDRMPTRLNVAAFIGHTPVRTYVLGDGASTREATADEVTAMRRLVAEGLEAGAIGFSTSRESGHWGAWGRPVPSRLASEDEVLALARELGVAGRGLFGIVAGPGFEAADLAGVAAEIGRPVSFTALVTGRGSGEKREHERRGKAMELLERSFPAGSGVFPQIACRPIVHQLVIDDPLSFYKLQSFSTVLTAAREERASIYADGAWRAEVIAEMDSKGWFESTWKHFSVAETTTAQDLVGIPLWTAAQEAGVHPFELMIEVALKDDLRTRFRVVASNDDEVELGQLLQDERTVLGLSDAGAHSSQLCDACFSTYLLSRWVRELGVLTLEKAVWRLTGHPAEVYGFADRGRIAPGYAADLVLFDPDTVGHLPLERRWDLPGSQDRLVAESVGIDGVWVNGVAVRRGGEDVDGNRARNAGAVLRSTAPS